MADPKDNTEQTARKPYALEDELRASRLFAEQNKQPASSGLSAMQKAGQKTVWQHIAHAIFRD